TRRRIAGQCGAHRAAASVTEHNNQTRAEMFDPVFDAAQSVVVDQIAGVPDYENISDVLIKDDFGRRARIRASENDGERMLRLSGLRAAGGCRFALRNFAADKT